jgi:hypothetical protein
VTVFKRKIFYVGGFDPRGVRFYYHLLKDEVARYAARTGEAATVTRRRQVSPIRSDWTVENRGQGVHTDYSFLRWEDIVNAAWIRNPLSLARASVATYLGHLRHLDLPGSRKLGKGPLITLFYPPLLTLLVPLLLALPVFTLLLVWAPWLLALLLGLAVGIAGSVPILKSIHAPWLLRFFAFNADFGDGEFSLAVQERLDRFAEEILPALDGDFDEVLLVTHSNGSILSVPLLARLLEARGGAMPAKFALVTLGHCIPLVAMRRDATRFHDRLRELAAGDFRWIDIGSPPDGAAYFGVDPMKLVEPAPRPQIELLSPRFHLFFDPATYHTGWRHKYDIHFDYLKTGDTVSPLALPSIAASAQPIADAVATFRAMP